MALSASIKLNSEQERAVCHEEGPLLIIAGAGTGKTSVLVNRLAWLVERGRAKSDQVLLLTFTEKAAQEMEGRAQQVLPYGCLDLWISTFHGFGERVLREHGLDIGLSINFQLLNDTEQWILIRKNLDRFNLPYYRPLGNPTKFISELIKHFSRLKDENISAAEYLSYVEELEASQDGKMTAQLIKAIKPGAGQTQLKRRQSKKTDEVDLGQTLDILRLKELAEAYHTYQQLLLENNFLDFGDLIMYTLKLFKERPNVRKIYRQRFKHIMVDEFQDTNWAQYELVKLLAAPQNNLVVVGDDDQAIYKFRGASLSNIMQFKSDYPTAAEIVLLENYRSHQEILDCAYRLIQNNNPARLEIKLGLNKRLIAKTQTVPASASEPLVQYLNFATKVQETAFVAYKIKELYEARLKSAAPLNWSDFAILVRANDSAAAYVAELNRLGIPNIFMSWRGLYYKPIILDILAYFRLLDNYHESAALFRVLNMAMFKVEQADLVTINKMAARKVWSLFEALKNIRAISGLSADAGRQVEKLLGLIEQHSRLVRTVKASQIFLSFIHDSGLLKTLDRDRDIEIFSYLDQFYRKIKSLEEAAPDLKLSDFLSAINLELEAGETGSLSLDFADHEAVKVMTVHGAKGLEFKYVFLVSLVDKRFPTIARSEKIPIPDALVRETIDYSVEPSQLHLAEERRLFYVAMTRAKIGLYLSGAKDYGGLREKKPSRFIAEAGLNDLAPDDVSLSAQNNLWRDLHDFNNQELVLSGNNNDGAKAQYFPPSRFSFSQLAAYSVCPLQYKFAFILKVPVPSDKSSFIFGRVLHNVLYNFLLPLIQNRGQGSLFSDQTDQDVGNNNYQASKESAQPEQHSNLITKDRILNLYQEFWQADGYASLAERSAYQAKGRQILIDFCAAWPSDPRPEIMFLEKKFSFKLGADIIKGTIDRVDLLPDGRLEIIDYKTGQAKNKLSFSDKRQLILYQLFLEEFLGRPVGLLSYYYLEENRKQSFVATDKDFMKLKEEIGQHISDIKAGRFDPQPTDMCRYCDFRNICEFRRV